MKHHLALSRLYTFGMRFRTKVGLATWIYLPTCLIWFSTALTSHRRSQPIAPMYWMVAGAYLLLISLFFAAYIFTWWDIRETGLFERRLWKTRSIPWTEIARIRPWQPHKRPIPNTIEILYHRDPPISDDGSIIATPSSIPHFLEALQTRAPQVIVDL